MKFRKVHLSNIFIKFFICFVFMFIISFNPVFASETENQTEPAEEVGTVKEVVVRTSVRPSGQCLESLEVTVTDETLLEGLTAEDFTMEGKAESWLNPTLHDFQATISDVSVDGNKMVLTVTDFTEKYFYVDQFEVTCIKNPGLSFGIDKVVRVETPVADEFEQIREETGGEFDYNLYTPEDTENPQPIVIVFHGYGDTENLLQNKLAVAWAEDENQKERPCYVLAPVISTSGYFSGSYRDGIYTDVYDKVQEMISEGKVDPDRIYVVGKSFGGAAAYEFLEKYPEDIAGAIAMCGGFSYLGLNTEDIVKMKDIPLWIAHATTDPTVPVTDSRMVYQTLTEAGSTVVKYTEYSDEEMTEAGVTEAMGNHSVEAVVLEDVEYMKWLFSQNNSNVEEVVARTSVRPSGQCLESLEVTVTDEALLEGLTAEDFTMEGKAESWLNPTLHDFQATISDVSVDGNKMVLTVTDFTEKYFYVDQFEVTCIKNPGLSFGIDKVVRVETPVADEFEQIREETGGEFDYNLYTPEDTENPQPIVIVFHGYGDTENLLQNKLAVAWAEDENQKERPCYVLAPVISTSGYFSGSYRDGIYTDVYDKVQEMISEGKVDPDRIYVVGKSFGGAAAYEFLEKYPEDIAGAIAMCGGFSYLGLNTEDIVKMKDIPLWIAHATTDPTVPVTDSRMVYQTLTEAGSTVVKYTEYSDEEMTEAGVTEAMGNHSVEAVVLEDVEYMEWLFSQNLNKETEEPGTEEPGTETPGTEEPGTETPGTEEPGTETPGTDKPSADDPSSDKPSTDKGNGDKSGTTDKGQSDQTSKAAKTGDSVRATGTFVMFGLSVVVIVAALVLRKRYMRR